MVSKKNRSRKCQRKNKNLRLDMFMDDDADEYLPQKNKEPTFKSGIPKSVTCLTIEGSVVNTGETTEPDDSYLVDTCDYAEEDDDYWEYPDDDDDAEEFFSSNDTEAAERDSQASWEEISEVSSVHSFHSKTGMTFLEVAQMAKTQPKSDNDMDNWIAVAKGRKVEVCQAPAPRVEQANPEEMGELMDDQFILEGQKGARGGKERYMYNRQPQKKYRKWRAKGQLDAMVRCGRVPSANNVISDRQGNRVLVKA